MRMHGQQRPLDKVGLPRRLQPYRDIGFPHAEVELGIGQDQRDVDLRIELDELLDARRQPKRAEADRRGDLERAGRPFLAFGKLRLGHGELVVDLVRGLVEHLALFGQNQAARMAMEQRRIEAFLERADLAADGGLAQIQQLARMRKAAGFRHRMEDA